MPTATGTSMNLDDLELELRKLPGVRATGFTERDDVLFVQVHMGSSPVDSAVPFQATRIAYRHSDRPVAVELVRWKRPQLAPDAPSSSAEAPTTGPSPAPRAPAPVGFRATAPTTGAGGPELDDADESPAPGESAAVDATGTADTPNESDTSDDGPADADPSVSDHVTILVERRVRLLAVLTFPDTDELEVHLTLEGRRTIGRAAASRGLLGAVEATTDAVRAFVPELSFVPSWARTLEATPGQPFLVAVGLIGDEESEARHGLAGGNSPIEAAARATLHALNRTLSTDLQPGS
ncbi:MAG: hypothetical protein JWL73_3135 [Actinomycetia bacterium]|nr:hypothetical protein [Actinomycetes bacterium]